MSAIEVFQTDPIKALGLQEPVTIGQEATVGQALEKVQQTGKGYVLVLDPDRKPAGFMTEREVLMKIVARDIKYDDNIGQYMGPPPRCLTEMETIATAVRLMAETGDQNIPIVDGAGRAVTVLRTLDIVHFLAEAFPAQVLNMPPDSHQLMPKEEGG